jgi:hypothetical protein
MSLLRAFVLGLIVAAIAATAAAQTLNQFEIDNLRAQQQAAQQRAIAQSNEQMALEARLRADQAVANLQAPQPRVPQMIYQPANSAAPVAAAKYPSVPDAVLADSNKRVQDAAANRR